MPVQVSDDGRVITVTPEYISGRDVLEFALALIETYGWLNYMENSNQGKSVESSDLAGYTLHDAIGAVGTKVAQGPGVVIPSTSSHDKNFRTERRSLETRQLETVSLRQLANVKLFQAIEEREGVGMDDKAWENTPGRTQADVEALLRRAIEL